jgi:DNA-binding response OmpR family regulator
MPKKAALIRTKTKVQKALPIGQNGKEKIRKVLNTWKEIAVYVSCGVRTVQRYERDLGLPVRRVSDSDRSTVLAFSDELDQWLNDTRIKEQRYVRPTLIVLDRMMPHSLSNRKLVLEIGRFNVLTAYTAEEAYATAAKFRPDAFILDHIPSDDSSSELCECLKELYPKTPLIAVLPELQGDEEAVACADYVVKSQDAGELLALVIQVLGKPKME